MQASKFNEPTRQQDKTVHNSFQIYKIKMNEQYSKIYHDKTEITTVCVFL